MNVYITWKALSTSKVESDFKVKCTFKVIYNFKVESTFKVIIYLQGTEHKSDFERRETTSEVHESHLQSGWIWNAALMEVFPNTRNTTPNIFRRGLPRWVDTFSKRIFVDTHWKVLFIFVYINDSLNKI